MFRGKHLVILGAGYVGGALCRAVLAGGGAVTALTRNAAQAEWLRRGGADVIVADLASDAWHAHPVRPFAGVVNCVSSGGGGVDGYRRSYLEGMQSILRWIEGVGTTTAPLVYTSSTSVYPHGGGEWVDETQDTGATEPTTEVLLETEAHVRRWPGPQVILRLAGIYGPGRHHLLDQLRSGASELPGIGSFHLNLIHRDDIVAAVGCALSRAPDTLGRAFNVVDDHPTPKLEVVSWLAAKLGRPVPSFTGDPAPGRRRVVPDRRITNARIKQELGWAPRYPSYRDGYTAILEA